MPKTLNELIGKRIVKIRPISDEELDNEGWDGHGATSVLELEDGTIIYPSSDDEGNNAGTLFGKDKNGKSYYVWSEEEVIHPLKTTKKSKEELQAQKIKNSIFKDLRDYFTSVKTLFPSGLQISISKRMNLIYSLGKKAQK